VFVGTFEHALDDKGRLVLPSVFRGRLAEGGVVTKLDGCLGVWTSQEFEQVAATMLERVRRGEAPREVVRTFAADAHHATPDATGRIVLPARLREFAGLAGEVVVNGALDHIEIWDSERWSRVNSQGEEHLADTGYSLSDLGI
jgi:MraZ protein